MTPRPPTGVVVGLAVAAVACLALELRFNHLGGLLRGEYSMLTVLWCWWAAFALAAWCVLRLPRRVAVATVLIGTAVFQAAALTSGPQLSDDLYRYAWDGRVQAAGVDPYRYPPDDPRLAALRDSWLWPGPAECIAIERQPGCTRLNRPAERTIYPPVAQLWFRFLDLVLPAGAREKGLQAAHAAVGLGVAALLIGALAALGRNPAWAVLYAWSPMAVIEVGMDAHVDVLAVAATVAAIWMLARNRAGVGGALLGAAVAIKLIPGLVLPAALRSKPLRVVAAASVVVGASYLPHVLSVGARVLGYLPGYLREEAYGEGSRFLLLGLVGLRGDAAKAVAVLLIGGAAAWAALRRGDHSIPTRARWLLTVVFLVVTPVQPWYALLLVAVATFDGAWETLAVAAAGYPLYFGTLIEGYAPGFGMASYGAAAVVVAAAALGRRLHASRAAAVMGDRSAL